MAFCELCGQLCFLDYNNLQSWEDEDTRTFTHRFVMRIINSGCISFQCGDDIKPGIKPEGMPHATKT